MLVQVLVLVRPSQLPLKTQSAQFVALKLAQPSAVREAEAGLLVIPF